ncbi:hypothetical protein GCM10027568_20870 [Humibacter soli]
MTSVDLAFANVANAAGLTDVTYWRLWDVSEWREFRGDVPLPASTTYLDPDTGMTYQSLRGRLDEVLNADRVVFWGDFMHMAVYQHHMSDVLARRIGLCSEEEADELVANVQLLRGSDAPALGRVLSYGSTLSMNTWQDYASRYGRDLEHFIDGADRVWLRDPYSAQVARSIRGQERGTAQALDAAFLLHDGIQHGGNGLGVFIGRSAVQPEVVATFGRQLAKGLDLRATWIPWGTAPAFWPVDSRRRFRAAWPALEREEAAPSRTDLVRTSVAALRGVPKPSPAPASLRDLIFGLSNYDVVLTDTYHLAINAWAQGVPAVCLVDEGGADWSVNSGEPNMRRDKRIDLYSQLEALGLIVSLKGLRRRGPQEVRRVIELLRTPESLAVVRNRIDTLRAQSFESIVTRLKESAQDRTHEDRRLLTN